MKNSELLDLVRKTDCKCDEELQQQLDDMIAMALLFNPENRKTLEMIVDHGNYELQEDDDVLDSD